MAYQLPQRRAARLIPVRIETLRYRLTRDPQDALRQRLRELAAVRVRFGYRRLTVLLKREGWRVNAKRIYRLYSLERLEVRTKPRKKLASRARVPLPRPTRPNERWSNGLRQCAHDRRTMVPDVNGAGPLHPRIACAGCRPITDRRQGGVVLSDVLRRRPAPQAITVDNGSEFLSRAMDAWRTRTMSDSISFGRGSRSRMPSSKASTANSATSA
jgi:putative transposase